MNTAICPTFPGLFEQKMYLNLIEGFVSSTFFFKITFTCVQLNSHTYYFFWEFLLSAIFRTTSGGHGFLHFPPRHVLSRNCAHRVQHSHCSPITVHIPIIFGSSRYYRAFRYYSFCSVRKSLCLHQIAHSVRSEPTISISAATSTTCEAAGDAGTGHNHSRTRAKRRHSIDPRTRKSLQ